jgi:1-phosphatidylinositol-3-phosphate 5-kinase
MENLFYDQKIVKTFDLKGIQRRKVKSSASGTAKEFSL